LPYYNPDKVIADPILILVPVNHEIRIPLEVILATIGRLDTWLKNIKKQNPNTLPDDFKWVNNIVWDVYLTSLNSFRQETRERTFQDSNERVQILTKPMPRFIWRARMLLVKAQVIDLILDTTGIEQGNLLLQAITYSPEGEQIKSAVNDFEKIKKVDDSILKKILTQLKQLWGPPT